MASGYATANLRYQASSRRSGGSFLQGLLRLEAWLDARAGRRALQTFDDRTLADLGLTRSDVARPDPTAAWQGLMLPFSRR